MFHQETCSQKGHVSLFLLLSTNSLERLSTKKSEKNTLSKTEKFLSTETKERKCEIHINQLRENDLLFQFLKE